MDTTRSEQIKTGLQKSFYSEKSAKASTVCYGYRIAAEGDLMVYPAEAIYVFQIFERFAAGDSLGKISTSLARMNVLSPTGKDIWGKETISKILKNEKYLGDVVLGKTLGLSTKTTLTKHHPAIISKELFDSVQKEKSRRHRSRGR